MTRVLRTNRRRKAEKQITVRNQPLHVHGAIIGRAWENFGRVSLDEQKFWGHVQCEGHGKVLKSQDHTLIFKADRLSDILILLAIFSPQQKVKI